jgi:SAM-dependent methyltransferase
MNVEQLAAQIYDQTVADWPGEMDYYRHLASRSKDILEIACGTGRVSLRLAADHRRVVGLDLSPQMIERARSKSPSGTSIDWLVADMRQFDLGRTFGLAIIPGHSFQFMLTIADQLSCLRSIREHMEPRGRLVVHVNKDDLKWLGALPTDQHGSFERPSEVRLPDGRAFRVAKRWSYDAPTQTASVSTRYDQLDDTGATIESAIRGPVRLHCFFRYEMELLLQRAGFEVASLFGDFARGELAPTSAEMIWETSRS